MKIRIHKTKIPLFILLLLFASTLLITCEKINRDNPWDEKADLDPNSWAPQNLEIELTSITERKLTWQYGDYNIEGFKIDRKEGEGVWVNAYATLENDVRSWNDISIMPDASLTYSYRVYAYAGNNVSSIQVLEFESDFPAPSELKLDQQPESDIAYRLSWKDNSDGEEGFKIDRKTGAGDWIVPFDSVPKNQTEYVDTNVFIGKSTMGLNYRVYAYYGEFESEKVFTDTEAFLPAPSNLEITVNSITSVSLNWQDNSTSEEGFRIERKLEGGDWEELVTTQENTMNDNDFELNTIVFYRVSAYYGEYSSDYVENSFDSSIPHPTNFEITINSISSVSLNWQDNSIGEDGFRIDRKLNDEEWQEDYASVSANETTYGDNNVDLVANHYEYRVYAHYGEYNSSYTEAAYVPLTVTTDDVTNVTGTSAMSGGTVIGSHVDSRGIAYGISQYPDIYGNTVPEGSGFGNFTAVMIGLTPETNYHVRAYAINEVGVAYGNNVTFKTLFPCGTNITFMYKGQEVTYGTIDRGGLCWMDRNLGASRVPTSSTDSQGYGDLFQWGRLDDGHQNRTSGTTSTLSNTDVPGHGNFITVNSSPYDWRSPQNNNLWQGENSINNPCPPNWRVPTEAELNAERQSWGSNNSAGAYTSTLKWPVGGYRYYTNGYFGSVGSWGYVWSSSVSDTDAIFLYFGSDNALVTSLRRPAGVSVRCVREP